jgi:hypothetical protein
MRTLGNNVTTCPPPRFKLGSVGPAGQAARTLRTSTRLAIKAPIPPAAMMQVIGQGIPSANQPTAALETAPMPNCTAPARADAVPARCGNAASAPAMALAVTSPSIETNPNTAHTSPARPPRPV